MAKKRHGLAASVASARPAEPSLDEKAAPRRRMKTFRNGYSGGQLWDRQGRPWSRVKEWLDPPEVQAALADGAGWMYEPCVGDLEWPATEDTPPPAEAMEQVVTRHRARRLLDKGNAKPTVVVAELWRSAEGDRELVVFRDGAPMPRSPVWYRES